jgi:4-hydroxybenzoate polyprenyltransferase
VLFAKMSHPPRPEFEPLSEAESLPTRRSGILPWLRLMRLPNVFTAIADVAMGYLFVHRTVENGLVLACLVAASAALYTVGMVLNDVFDFEVDSRERPFRPLPAGEISLIAAKALGFTLLALGLALGWFVGDLPGVFTWPWRSGVVASLLAACVLAYDGFLKNTPLGPLGMGACRFLNIVLGMSTSTRMGAGIVFGFGPPELLAALGIGIYVSGVTWFARAEAGASRREILAAAMAVMAGGVAVLGSSALFALLRVDRQVYWLLLALLMFSVLRRCGAAAIDPTPPKVQAGVKHSILSLIWLDAATVLAVADPMYAIAIAALLIPALLLGRWVYST